MSNKYTELYFDVFWFRQHLIDSTYRFNDCKGIKDSHVCQAITCHTQISFVDVILELL